MKDNRLNQLAEEDPWRLVEIVHGGDQDLVRTQDETPPNAMAQRPTLATSGPVKYVSDSGTTQVPPSMPKF
jgi:hypothetical protein